LFAGSGGSLKANRPFIELLIQFSRQIECFIGGDSVSLAVSRILRDASSNVAALSKRHAKIIQKERLGG
jgi:hypothetical protein